MRLNGFRDKFGLKIVLALCIILSGIYFIYFTPKKKYRSRKEAVKILNSIPKEFSVWKGIDIENIENKFKGDFYNFLNRVFVRKYSRNNKKDFLYLIILDAGNFHYPKVCFKGAGYKTSTYTIKSLKIKGKELKLFSQLNQKGNEKILTLYWIVLDGKVVNSWEEQKIRQFFYSLFNKKHVGFMIRIDIPLIDEEKTKNDINEFLSELYDNMHPKDRKYIFGF